VPQYLTNSLPSLNEQWNALVKYYENRPQPSRIYKNKGKDPVFTDEILHRELSVVIGRRGYNRDTVIGLLNALSSEPRSASPPVGETGISLDEFIRSTITPVAPAGECDMDPLHIKLYVHDGKLQRLLTQVELNWFFTGTYNEYETNSVTGLLDPVAKVPVSISDLINLYNLFYRHRQTRSGLQLKDTDFDPHLGVVNQQKETIHTGRVGHLVGSEPVHLAPPVVVTVGHHPVDASPPNAPEPGVVVNHTYHYFC
jgi:hypothetical protein